MLHETRSHYFISSPQMLRKVHCSEGGGGGRGVDGLDGLYGFDSLSVFHGSSQFAGFGGAPEVPGASVLISGLGRPGKMAELLGRYVVDLCWWHFLQLLVVVQEAAEETALLLGHRAARDHQVLLEHRVSWGRNHMKVACRKVERTYLFTT